MYSGANHDVEMPLPRLPAADGRRICSRSPSLGRGVTISRQALPGENTNAVFARNADRELPEQNLKRGIRRLSEFWLPAWTTRVGSSRRWIFSFQTLNRGIKWIPQFRNLSSIHHQQRNNTECKRLRRFCGSMIKLKRQ